MGTIIMIAQLILALSILVVLHEFGHFIAARAFGIRVEKFYLFFNPWFSIFKIKLGETEYGIGWLPLGGYVKISGMIDESMDKEQMKKPPQTWEFRSKPAWQRLIVMLGGVIMNLILGVIVFSFILFHYEKDYIPIEQVNNDGIYADSLGRDLGFESGDKVLEIDGKSVTRFKDLYSLKVLVGGSTITVDRKGQEQVIAIPEGLYKIVQGAGIRYISNSNFKFRVDSVEPESNAEKAGLLKYDSLISLNNQKVTSYGEIREMIGKNVGEPVDLVIRRGNSFDTLLVQVDTTGLVGFSISIPYTTKNYNFFSSISYGIKDAGEFLMANVIGFGRIIKGKEDVSKSVQGPIGIATMFGYNWNWERFWRLTGLLSLILAFMNILPIPALDGGHVMFLSYEIITRRKPSDKFLEYAQIAGMVIILMLMVLVIGNDIFRLWKG